MVLSVQTKDAISNFTIDTTLSAGSGALTAALLYSPNSITPMLGSLYGIAQNVSTVAIICFVYYFFNINLVEGSLNSKKLSNINVFILNAACLVASSAVAGAAVAAAGCSLTATQIALFTITHLMVTLPAYAFIDLPKLKQTFMGYA